LQTRYIGKESAHINGNSIYVEYSKNIATAYPRGKDESIEIFLVINNVLNRDAPSIP